jgi:hypothetical protein
MNSSFRRNITVTRKSAGSFVKGRWVVTGLSKVFTIKASVQSPTPRELEALPEARRSKDTSVLYTNTPLFTAEVSTAKNPDIVTLNGEPYEVHSCAVWGNKVIPHYKVIVTKQDQ